MVKRYKKHDIVHYIIRKNKKRTFVIYIKTTFMIDFWLVHLRSFEMLNEVNTARNNAVSLATEEDRGLDGSYRDSSFCLTSHIFYACTFFGILLPPEKEIQTKNRSRNLSLSHIMRNCAAGKTENYILSAEVKCAEKLRSVADKEV